MYFAKLASRCVFSVRGNNLTCHLRLVSTKAQSCIGKNISLMEMGKFVPQILRQFHLYWVSEKAAWTVNTYWFARQSDLIVRFQTRKK
jgi:hypothetical protein